ncbi:DUF2975 domain-containing protein [Clostridium saccharoperbutylacetonicum]|uniref:DUF2975 domain-containing protein n=1 Tax=Clostridium saccharoperbutylacetonicum TaxID=36745 RepID=UPI0009840454|nr:DUF2975 domain-containing protein [Clostridium saccharoperbutylacetonicum]AQR94305.1 hypothetical protein CLSAP_16120 [Clostridium saccharoperbutylacetonicum]NSB30005.1 hypothetical protein [Clostridium saccharoperbutylacetonicum]
METYNKTISSIRNHCNNINYVVKIFLYIFLFVAFSSLIYTIIILIGFKDSLEVSSFKDDFLISSSNLHFFSGGNISKSLVTYTAEQPFSNIVLAFIISQIIFLIKQSLVISIFYYINKILTNIENNYTPFIIENSKKIKLVGLLIIAYSILPNLIAYPLLKLITKGVSLDINSSIPIIFAASFILLLSKIFTYGCELQKDSDETL